MPQFSGPGKLVRLGLIRSHWVGPRKVAVWLPAEYESHRQRGGPRYGALYMHDGQNLFESHTAFGGVHWGVAATAQRLLDEGRIPPTLVVGVWNTPLRMTEYLPGHQDSDGYLRFLAEELKPLIDLRFYTGEGSSVMGSSMGGLISLRALCRYPQVYGAAGCLSTHWPALDETAIASLIGSLPAPSRHRLYFDYGTETADAPYGPLQLVADQALRARGYQAGVDWQTLRFPGQDHSERAWRARLHQPLEFLLGENLCKP